MLLMLKQWYTFDFFLNTGSDLNLQDGIESGPANQAPAGASVTRPSTPTSTSSRSWPVTPTSGCPPGVAREDSLQQRTDPPVERGYGNPVDSAVSASAYPIPLSTGSTYYCDTDLANYSFPPEWLWEPRDNGVRRDCQPGQWSYLTDAGWGNFSASEPTPTTGFPAYYSAGFHWQGESASSAAFSSVQIHPGFNTLSEPESVLTADWFQTQPDVLDDSRVYTRLRQ